MRNETARELRRLKQQLERTERRIALARLPGKVKEVDAGKRTLRLKLGTAKDGSDILSPKMGWQESAAGGMKIHSEPAIGEQMVMVSASGTVGQSSIAAPATYDKDNDAPSQSSDTAVLERGAGRIEIGASGIRFIGDVRVEGGILTHEGRNVGHDHLHIDVTPGPALTGPPQP